MKTFEWLNSALTKYHNIVLYCIVLCIFFIECNQKYRIRDQKNKIPTFTQKITRKWV